MFFFIQKNTELDNNDNILSPTKKCIKQEEDESKVKAFIVNFVKSQPELLSNILKCRWLIDKKYSYKKLAIDSNLSYEQVRQCEIKAYKKLICALEIESLI